MEPEYILVKSKSHNDEAEMGEQQTILFQPAFNRAARVETSPTPISEDAGVIALREVSETLGLPALLAGITDLRDPERITHPVQELIFSRIFLLAQGWQDQDDADVLRPDPALRLAVSSRAGDGPVRPPQKPRQPSGLASQPTLSRLNHALAHPDNIAALELALLRCAIARIRRVHGHLARLVVDIDSFPIEAHGARAGNPAPPRPETLSTRRSASPSPRARPGLGTCRRPGQRGRRQVADPVAHSALDNAARCPQAPRPCGEGENFRKGGPLTPGVQPSAAGASGMCRRRQDGPPSAMWVPRSRMRSKITSARSASWRTSPQAWSGLLVVRTSGRRRR